jgi:hypothetical protein
MPGANDPSLVAKALAKAQSVEARLDAITGSDLGPQQPVLVYNTAPTVVTQSVSGLYSWTCPAGVTSILVECWGAGGGGSGGSATVGGAGGGGGAYSAEPAYPVTPGVTYSYLVGDGGTGGVLNQPGADGGQTWFDINGLAVAGAVANGVVAAGGTSYNGNSIGGLGGAAAATQTIAWGGGNGGGDAAQSTGGCGGGSSASSSANGGNGGESLSSTGAAGGTDGSGSGAGGAGGNASASGVAGSSPGGGGGGCGTGTITSQVTFTYNPTMSATWYGSDAIGGNANKLHNITPTSGTLIQGGISASGGNYNGTMKAMMILPSSVSSDLAAVTIDFCTLSLSNLFTSYSTGATLLLGYTSNTSPPATYTGSGITAVSFYTCQPGGKQVQPLTATGLPAALKSGAATALTLGLAPALNPVYYAAFTGAGGGTSAPSLLIRGHTSGSVALAGTGADGQVQITYTLPTTVVSAVQPFALTDDAGNAVAAGYTGQVSAFQPASSPTVVETWHSLSPVNSWTSTLKYKYQSDNTVYVLGTASSPSSITSSTCGVLPAGYRPATNTDYPVTTHTGTMSGVFIRVDTAGDVIVFNAVASTVYVVSIRVPLDY